MKRCKFCSEEKKTFKGIREHVQVSHPAEYELIAAWLGVDRHLALGFGVLNDHDGDE